MLRFDGLRVQRARGAYERKASVWFSYEERSPVIVYLRSMFWVFLPHSLSPTRT